MKTVVIGGGAAGFFAAIHGKALLLERSSHFLSKVKISGGGRCNVTTAVRDPHLMIQNYPRGSRELLGPFHHFGSKEVVDWFEREGIQLKSEPDGRMFPQTNRSQTIIDCLMNAAKALDLRTKQKILSIKKLDKGFSITTSEEEITCEKLILATGSSRDGYRFAESLGHTIHKPVPSLFTFNVPSSPLKELSGIAIQNCKARIVGSPWEQEGPVLITHFGFSGPAIIKLSAWAARSLFEKGYRATLEIEWTPPLPKRLKRLVQETKQRYDIDGKTTHKEEFVTCGGVALKEIDFRTMESRICPGLHFAGEILDIDGVTGGFNFQSAWTTGFLAGRSAS